MTHTKVARIGKRYPRIVPATRPVPAPGRLVRWLGCLVAFRRIVRL
jgi:hypothetical protein